MTGTNHYLAGVASAVVFKNPALAIPVAFASHFVLDALPHFGLQFSKDRAKVLLSISTIDILLLAMSVVFTVHSYPIWYVFAGLTAVSPDFAWVYRFTIREKFGKLPPPPTNRFNNWHASLQKLESVWGGFVEIGFLIFLSLVLFKQESPSCR